MEMIEAFPFIKKFLRSLSWRASITSAKAFSNTSTMKGVIYQIVNKQNGKKYIGSTVDPEGRKKRHFRELENENHHSIALQRAWNKYGGENFKFKVIKKVKENLRETEQKLLDKNEGEYNISPEACGGNLIENHPNKKEINEKKAAAVRNRMKNLSKDERKQKYGRNKEKNGNWKGGKTYCGCGSKKMPKSNTCEKCRDKTGKNNPFYGKSHSEETKRKLSEKRKGKYNGNQNKPVTNGEQTFSSLSEASRSESVVVGTISNRVNSDTFPNWQYI
jgi:group I intron endonuclease